MSDTELSIVSHGVLKRLEVTVLEKDDANIRFLVQEADVPFMNALRRLVTSQVPTMAMDEIVTIENSSVLQDEIIAHRLGLIPLRTDLDAYNLPEECKCKSEFGCNLCRVTFTLDVEAEEGIRTVYSGDLVSENPDVVPVNNKIPIVKLVKEQKIKLEAYAKLGKGKSHAKWQPVSMCTYKYLPKIDIKKHCDFCGKCVEVCPKKILIKRHDKIEIRDSTACTLCKDRVAACRQNTSAISVSWEENAFIFNLESTDALPPERIMVEATKILEKQLKKLQRQIKVKKNEKS